MPLPLLERHVLALLRAGGHSTSALAGPLALSTHGAAVVLERLAHRGLVETRDGEDGPRWHATSAGLGELTNAGGWPPPPR